MWSDSRAPLFKEAKTETREGEERLAQEALNLLQAGVEGTAEEASSGIVIGKSPAMATVMQQVRLVAPRDTTVLITGETGTGKEQIAGVVRVLSQRQRGPMVCVNCGGIPATLLEDEFFGHVRGAFTDAKQTRIGRFEQANRGTIFLDEIGDLPLELQPKLLRVLQEREVHRVGGVEPIQLDVRVIAATNVDLWERVGEGRFREDLYYRINVYPIHLPPLRERAEDIPLLIQHFLDRLCRRERVPRKFVTPAAEVELRRKTWRGNIRELQNAVEIAFIRSESRTELLPEDFPGSPQPTGARKANGSEILPEGIDFRSLVLRYELELIQSALRKTNGNKNQAAKLLRLKRTTLIEKLKRVAEREA